MAIAVSFSELFNFCFKNCGGRVLVAGEKRKLPSAIRRHKHGQFAPYHAVVPRELRHFLRHRLQHHLPPVAPAPAVGNVPLVFYPRYQRGDTARGKSGYLDQIMRPRPPALLNKLETSYIRCLQAQTLCNQFFICADTPVFLYAPADIFFEKFLFRGKSFYWSFFPAYPACFLLHMHALNGIYHVCIAHIVPFREKGLKHPSVRPKADKFYSGVFIVPSSDSLPIKTLATRGARGGFALPCAHSRSCQCYSAPQGARPSRSNSQKFSCLKRKRKGVWGKSPKR